jgi:hypothetical protein
VPIADAGFHLQECLEVPCGACVGLLEERDGVIVVRAMGVLAESCTADHVSGGDAEARVALGDLPGAADRLRGGQRRARSGGTVDFIEVSVIDARLRDIERQRKKNDADEKAFK